jgi:prepilin-type N-terminal cleavage/methylation domain-containing protein
VRQEGGFTLMEIMIVVILIGVLAAFAIPNYSKAVQKGRERSASVQLMATHAANKIYFAQNGVYYPSSLADYTLINTAFGINIIPDSSSTTYTYTSFGSLTGCTAVLSSSVSLFVAHYYPISKTPVTVSGTTLQANPCCLNTSNCLTVPKCL